MTDYGKGAVYVYSSANDVLGLGVEDLLELGTTTLLGTDFSLIHLKIDHGDFSQSSGRLAIKSQGNQRIPYYNLESGFSSSPTFYYNYTSDVLHIGEVQLNQSYTLNANSAVHKNYVDNLYKQGQGLLLSADKTFSVNVDNSSLEIIADRIQIKDIQTVSPLQFTNKSLSLSIDGDTLTTQNGILKANYTPTAPITITGNNIGLSIDNSTLATQNGILKANYQAGTNIILTNNTIATKAIQSGSRISLVHSQTAITINNTIALGKYLVWKTDQTTIDCSLTAGNNISIVDNAINATYTAGNNISITNGVIANTLSAGSGISITNGVIANTRDFTAGSGISITNGTINNTRDFTAGTGINIIGGTISTDTSGIIDGTTIIPCVS